MKCPKCKAKNDKEDDYCSECGSPLKEEEKEKGLSFLAFLVWFIVFLIVFSSLYFFLTEIRGKKTLETLENKQLQAELEQKDLELQKLQCEKNCPIECDVYFDLSRANFGSQEFPENEYAYQSYEYNKDTKTCICKCYEKANPSHIISLAEMKDSDTLLKS